jgi:hypothetical protein
MKKHLLLLLTLFLKMGSGNVNKVFVSEESVRSTCSH